ncbi:MAG: ATP-binding cassette domain-containing protein, partial [Thiotrichaceae bacterium]|nr:ATP-binding cassette domain-containing protein [Thiotrichaceae bacterium]
AQSRIKMLEKMELVSITQTDSPFSFKFSQSNPCSNPLFSMRDVEVSYGTHKVLKGVNFSLGPQDAIGILGINGAGKSTFMKTLAGVLNPSGGSVFFNKGIKIGYFAQHQVDQLDMQASPMTHILRLDPGVKEQQVRTFLGGFGFRDSMVFGQITNFSGGEKARLVLALLIWQKPNLLLLDEPTNHLDLEMRTSLTYALQEYTGALVLVAHDRYLYKATVNEFCLVNDNKVTKFPGDLDDYQRWLLAERKQQSDVCDVKKGDGKISSSVKASEVVKVSTKEIRKLEQELKKAQGEKERIVLSLTDSAIYEQENRSKLDSLLKKSAAIEVKIKLLEEKWLEFSA